MVPPIPRRNNILPRLTPTSIKDAQASHHMHYPAHTSGSIPFLMRLIQPKIFHEELMSLLPSHRPTNAGTSECHPPPLLRCCWRGPWLHLETHLWSSIISVPLESSLCVLFTVWFRSLGLMWHMLCTVYICAVQNSDIPDFTLIGFIQGGRARPQILGLDHSSMSPLPSPSTSYPQMNAHTPLVQLPIHYRKQHKYFPQDAHRHHSLPMLAVPGMIPQHIGEEFVQQRH
jgi:hypothetical protein